MNRRSIVLFTAAFLFLVAVGTQAQNAKLNIPLIQHNICPFECCQYGTWTARSALKAFKNEGDDSTILFTIKQGEAFTALSGNVHISKPGLITIHKAFGPFKSGDEVYVLSYRGEGEYDLWFNGKEVDISTEDASSHGTFSQLPEFVWWVYIVNRDGKKGWLRFKNISNSGFQTEDKVDGDDSCS